MEEKKQNSGNARIFAIVGIILGSFSLIFSMIPCVGTYAFIPALLAAIFSLIAYFTLKTEGSKTGLAIAGSVISILAICLSFYQYYAYQEVFETKRKIDEGVQTITDKINEEITDEVLDELKEALDSVDLYDGDKIRILESTDSLSNEDSTAH